MASPIQFDKPIGLLLILLVIPAVWLGWRSLRGMGPVRRSLVCALRSLVIILLASALAQPRWLERSEALTVVLLIDRSQSITQELELAALEYLRDALADPESGRLVIDRVAIINIGGDARVEATPERTTVLGDNIVLVDRNATNLAQGLRLGMAIAPRDTATRFVLVSDGNETMDNAMAVADIARANEIPIDVLVLEYDHGNEVIFDRIIAPSQARQGQNVGLRFVLRARKAMQGVLSLTQNGDPIDLDPETDSMGLRIVLEEGVNTFQQTVTLHKQGPQRFRAFFEPDDPTADTIVSNNRADAVIVVGGEGRVLLVEENSEEAAALVAALAEAQIDVDRWLPQDITGDLLALSAYDAVIMANIPAHIINQKAQEALRRYVHDIGGGLIMLGGPEGFGAGGWIDSPLAKALPLKLEPPEERKMPRGALVCIMHSSEMPNGNFIGQQSAIAAIQALSRLDLAGIIDYNWNVAGAANGCVWEYPLSLVGDKSAAIAAIKKMPMGDMPDFVASMQLALQGLTGVKAGQKHVIIISDGDPQRPPKSLLDAFVAANITISTVVAGGHGNAADAQKMAWIANFTGGRFYNPKSATDMPQIFIKEAIVVRRSLIVEGEVYQAIHNPSPRPGPFRGRWSALPDLDGYVLTTPRPGYDPDIISNLNDPLMAHWQYGLGKAVAFTSDVSSRWGGQWVGWGQFEGFWEQVVRWSMRSSAPTNLVLNTRLEGGRVLVEVEAMTSDLTFANFGKIRGVVITPDLEARAIVLQQVGPGQWRSEFPADREGSWVIALTREDVDGTRSSIQGGVSVPYSMEFKALKDNRALLTNIAQRTGGRDLPSDPLDAELFEREGLSIPGSLSDMWPLMAILAASLFLVDVATRRISIDTVALRRRMRQWSAQRSSSLGASLDRLKLTRSQTQAQMNHRAAAGAAKPTAAGADVAVAGRRFEAGEDDGASIDVSRELTGDATTGQARRAARPAGAGDSKETDQATTSADDDSASYTSRLLEAKRRAREQREKGSHSRD